VDVPIAFAVPFDPANIDQSRDYVVTAAIFDASNRWTNQTGVPVITNGNPIAGITVPVSQAGATTTSDEGGLGLIGTILALIGIAALIAAIVVFIRSRRPPTTPAPAAAAAGPGKGAVPSEGAGLDERAGPDAGGGPAGPTG
jgi:hypothetical protein